jgi:predicted transcriptional regulator
MGKVNKGVRITGAARKKLTRELQQKYEKGASLRGLAEQTGRSYGFVHRILTDAGVPLRARGGNHRGKPPGPG